MAADNPQTINEEAGLGPNWHPIDAPAISGRPAPPSVGDITPVIPQYFQGSLNPALQHDADFVNTALRSSSAPRFALMPVGIQASALTSAQITSVVKTATTNSTGGGVVGSGQVNTGGGGSSGPGSITLDIPVEFTPVTQTVDLPGPLVFAWAPEPAGYELSVPNGTVGFDGAFGTSGLSGGSLVIATGLPSTNPEWALYTAAVVTASFSGAPTPAGWTAISGNDANNAFYWKAVPTNGSVNVSQGLTAIGAFTGAISLFSGAAPVIIQSAVATDSGVGAMTATFGASLTAGSFVLAVFNSTSPTNAPSAGIFTDSQNLTQNAIFYGANAGDLTHFGVSQQIILLSVAAHAAEAVSVAYPSVNGGSLYVYEISGLSSIASIPRFMPEALVNLSNVTGILSVLNGGTGANLSRTGGAGKVVKQSTLGGAFTVGTLSAADLTNTTVGTGAILLATNPSITGTFLNINGIATVDNGVAIEAAAINLVAQSTALGPSTIFMPPVTGMYRISAYLKVTTVDATSSTLGALTITYTDGTDSVAQSNVMLMANEAGAAVTSNAGNTTAAKLIGSMVVWAKTGVAIQYAVAYASNVPGTMLYEVHLKLEAM